MYAFLVLTSGFFYAAVVGIKLCLILPLLWRWNFPMSQIPGPRIAAWTRIWWIKALYSGRSAQELVRLSREYGPVVRIAPKTVLVSDPNTIRRVLGVNSRYMRGPWFDSLRIDPHTTSVVSERDPKKHQQLRHILAGGLSGKDVPGVEAIIDLHVVKWMYALSQKANSSQDGCFEIDLSRVIPFLSMDISTHLCLGETFGNVETDRDKHGLLKALSMGMVAQQYIASLLELKTTLFWFGSLSFLRERIFPTAKRPTGIGEVMRIIQDKVKQEAAAKDKQGPPIDMLGSFLSRGLEPEQAASELIVVLFSAVGATSYTMQGIIRGIISNESVCQKLQHEIATIVEEQGVSTSECVSEVILKAMPYLQACISEGIRVYPAITQLRERVVPPEGDSLHGYHVPGGTFVAFNGLTSQFDPIHGDNLDAYRPERWLIEDKIHLAHMQRNLDLNFGYGTSKCLGINIASTEMSKVIFELFRRYDVTLSNHDKAWTTRGDFVLADFKVVLKSRSAVLRSLAFSPLD